jgi:hypothetical protein
MKLKITEIEAYKTFYGFYRLLYKTAGIKKINVKKKVEEIIILFRSDFPNIIKAAMIIMSDVVRLSMILKEKNKKEEYLTGGIIVPKTNIDIPIIDNIGKDIINNNENVKINLYVDGKLIAENIKKRNDI